MSRPLPRITRAATVARTRIFHVEEVDLTFPNGVQCTYERLRRPPRGAVMIVALTNDNEVLMIREYALGFERYELTLPKGAIDEGESPLEAAQRELQEECGMGAHELIPLCRLSLAPSYMDHYMHVVIARNLYPAARQGDEPEPLTLETRALKDIEEIIEEADIHEGRVIAALYRTQAWLAHHSLE